MAWAGTAVANAASANAVTACRARASFGSQRVSRRSQPLARLTAREAPPANAAIASERRLTAQKQQSLVSWGPTKEYVVATRPGPSSADSRSRLFFTAYVLIESTQRTSMLPSWRRRADTATKWEANNIGCRTRPTGSPSDQSGLLFVAPLSWIRAQRSGFAPRAGADDKISDAKASVNSVGTMAPGARQAAISRRAASTEATSARSPAARALGSSGRSTSM